MSDVAMLSEDRIVFLRDRALVLAEAATLRVLQTITPSAGFLGIDLIASADGSRVHYLQWEGERGHITTYRNDAGELVFESRYLIDGRPRLKAVTADGARFLLAFPEKRIAVFDAISRTMILDEVCECTGRFAADGMIVVAAGRFGADAANFGALGRIAVISVEQPGQRAVFDTGVKESLSVEDVSPDDRLAAIGTTNIGTIFVIPVVTQGPLKPAAILRDNSRQNVTGARFSGTGTLVSVSGDNTARSWGN